MMRRILIVACIAMALGCLALVKTNPPNKSGGVDEHVMDEIVVIGNIKDEK